MRRHKRKLPFEPRHLLEKLTTDHTIRRYSDARRYALSVLKGLAENKDLSVTELEAQPAAEAALLYDAIFGRGLDADKNPTHGHPVPDVLRDYQTRCISIPWNRQVDEAGIAGDFMVGYSSVISTVQWITKEVIGETDDFDSAKRNALAGGGGVLAQDIEFFDPVVHDTKETDVMLPIRNAVLCLRATGAFCKRAASTRNQRFSWKCREAMPDDSYIGKQWPYSATKPPKVGPCAIQPRGCLTAEALKKIHVANWGVT